MSDIQEVIRMIALRIKYLCVDKQKCQTVTCLQIHTQIIKELNFLHKEICEEFRIGSDE